MVDLVLSRLEKKSRSSHDEAEEKARVRPALGPAAFSANPANHFPLPLWVSIALQLQQHMLLFSLLVFKNYLSVSTKYCYDTTTKRNMFSVRCGIWYTVHVFFCQASVHQE